VCCQSSTSSGRRSAHATLTEGLEDAGLQAADFSDPGEALRPLETIAPPDVVVTDVDLANGFDVAVAAHDRWPSVRVILISGLPADHTGQRLDQRDRYLQKPLTYTRLLRTIEELAKAAWATSRETRFEWRLIAVGTA
jgi:two-component SAPR family response regulator